MSDALEAEELEDCDGEFVEEDVAVVEEDGVVEADEDVGDEVDAEDDGVVGDAPPEDGAAPPFALLPDDELGIVDGGKRMLRDTGEGLLGSGFGRAGVEWPDNRVDPCLFVLRRAKA